MTPKERAAVQRLIGLTAEICEYRYSDEIEQAYSDVREALAEQAEQKPVAYAPIITFRDAQHYSVSKQKTPEYCNPLYAAPVRTKDLTDEEIAQAVGSPLDEVYLADFRAVIAADREKNK